jgi:hypothetical protein
MVNSLTCGIRMTPALFNLRVMKLGMQIFDMQFLYNVNWHLH